MILDTTTRSLQVVLTTALTSVNMAVVVDYVDNTTTTFVPGLSPSTTNGVTPVTILSAPGSGVQRKVNSISINNIDTASKVVQVFLNDNSTLYQITSQTLNVGDTLCYSDTNGWYTKDSNGNIKGVGSPGTNGAQGNPGASGVMGQDGQDGDDGIPGVPGAKGANGATGPAGLPTFMFDGEDGQDGMNIPGANGTSGQNGATGPQGAVGIWMEPEYPDDPMPIPGQQGTNGTNGTTGTNGPIGQDGMDGEDAWMIPGPPGISASSVAQGPAFSAYLPTTNQSISSGVLTKVSLSSKEFDTTGAFDSTTNFRFQPLISGYYNITAVASMSGAAGTASSIIIYKNGSAFKNGAGETGAITAVQLDVSALIFLNGSTDYIELFVSYTGTTPVVVFGSNNTFFQGNLVSGIAASNGGGVQDPTFSTSVASNNLTISLNAGVLDFRNSTLTSGVSITVPYSATTLVIPNGATLGAPAAITSTSATSTGTTTLTLNNAPSAPVQVGAIVFLTSSGARLGKVASFGTYVGGLGTGTIVLDATSTITAVGVTIINPARIILGLLSNGEPFVMNQSGQFSFDETNLISTTAIGAGSTSNNVAYSTTLRSSLAYRVIGFIDIAEPVVGAYSLALELAVSTSGRDLLSIFTIGQGQAPADVTAQRVSGQTYRNISGRPYVVTAYSANTLNNSLTAAVNGVQVALCSNNDGVNGSQSFISFTVPAGLAYSITAVGATSWVETK